MHIEIDDLETCRVPFHTLENHTGFRVVDTQSIYLKTDDSYAIAFLSGQLPITVLLKPDTLVIPIHIQSIHITIGPPHG